MLPTTNLIVLQPPISAMSPNSTMNASIASISPNLALLIGDWTGEGVATYPTKPGVEHRYDETCTIRNHVSQAYFTYSQETTLKSNGLPSVCCLDLWLWRGKRLIIWLRNLVALRIRLLPVPLSDIARRTGPREPFGKRRDRNRDSLDFSGRKADDSALQEHESRKDRGYGGSCGQCGAEIRMGWRDS
jgi:hypothetical protein